MFEIDGKQYSVDDLQKAAVKYGMDYNAYLSKMMEKGLKEIKPAKTEDVAKVTAGVASGNQAVDTDLESEAGLLELANSQASYVYNDGTKVSRKSIVDDLSSMKIKLTGNVSSDLYDFKNGSAYKIKEGVTEDQLLEAYLSKFKNKPKKIYKDTALDEIVLTVNKKANKAEKTLEKINFLKPTEEQFLELEKKAQEIFIPADQLPTKKLTKRQGSRTFSSQAIEYPEGYEKYVEKAKGDLDKAKELYISDKKKSMFSTNVENWARENESALGNTSVKGFMEQMASAQKTVSEYSEKKLKSSDEKINILRGKLDTNVSEINRLKTLGFEATPEGRAEADIVKNQYNSIVGESENLVEEIKSAYEEQLKLAIDQGSNNLMLDVLKRSYSVGDITLANMTASASDLLAGALKLPEWAAVGYMSLKTGIDPTITKKIISATPGVGNYINTMESMAEGVKDFSGKLRSKVAKPVELENAFNSMSNFGYWATDLVSNQLPNTAIMIAAPEIALPILSASSAGNKYDSMMDNSEKYGVKYDAWQLISAPIIVGAAEYVTERVSLGQLRNVKKIFGKSPEALKAANKYIDENIVKGRYFTSTAGEGSAEGANQLTNNIVDIYMLGDKTKNIWDGVPNAVASGSFMSGVVYKAPAIGSRLLRPFAGSDTQAKLIKNSLEFQKISKELASNKDLSESSRESLVKAQARITNDSNSLLDKAISKIDDLSESDKTTLIELDSKAVNIQSEYLKLKEDQSLSEDVKKSLLSDLSVKFTELKNQKEAIINKVKFEKDVKNLEASLESIDQKVDETKVLEDDNEGLASDKFKQFLQENMPSDISKKTKQEQDKWVEDNKNNLGGFTTTKDGKEVLIINKTEALKSGVITTGQHEFLHKLLKFSMNSNPDLVTKAGKLLLSDTKSKGNNKQGVEFNERVNSYKSDLDKGLITTEKFYEEILPLYSEAISRKDISVNTSSIQKVKDFFRQVFQDKGYKKLDFSTEQGVINFIVDYNKSFSKGEFKGTLKDFAKGDVKAIAKPTKPGTSFSKSNKELGNEIKALVPEGTSKSRYDNQVIGNVYEKLVFGTTLDGLINGQLNKYGVVGDNVYGKPKDIFLEDVKAQLYEKSLMRFNPETNDDLGGFVVNELIKYRIGDVVNRYKKEAGVEGKSLDVAAGEVGSVQEVADESMSIEDQIDLDATQARSETRLTKATKIMSKEQYDKAAKMVEDKLKDIDPKKLSYKKIGGLATDILSEITNVPAGKILDATKNLSKEETSRGAMFIEKNIDYIRKTLPKGAVQEAATEKLMGTATGVANSILKRLYDKNPRIKKGAGLSPWSIKPGITNQDVLDAIGRPKREDGKKIQINPRSPEGQVIKGILNLVDRNIANELARTVESDLTLEQKQDVAAGKSDTMFSKALAKVLVESAVNHLGIKTRVGKGKLVGIVNDLLTTESYGSEEDFNKSLDNLTNEQRQVVDLVFGGRDWLFGMFSDTEAVKNNGVRYEKIIREAIKNVGIKGVSVDLSEGGFGSGVDLVLTVNGKNINIELKLNRRAQMGSFSINIDGDSFSYTKSVDGLIEKLPDLHEAIQNSLKSEKYLKAVDDYNKRGVELGGYYDKATGVLSGTESMFLQLVEEGKLKATNLSIKEDSKGKKLDVGIINLIYNNKGVFNMDIGGKGLYYLGTNKDNLPTSKLEGNSSLMIRRTYNQIGKTGVYKSIVRAFAKLDSNITESSINFSILSNTEQDIKTITNSFSKSLNLDKEFNDIIENKTGIESYKNYMSVKAQVVGASKGKFDFFIAPSAEDFVGLLYKTLGKGEVGDAQMAWYKENLLDPYARAMEKVSRDRNFMARSFLEIKKQLKIVPKNLKKKIPGEPFTQEQAIRVYIWNKKGSKIPGISKNDSIYLTNFVENNEKLKNFADQILSLSGSEDYADAGDSWVTGTITTDLLETLNTTKRRKYLELWQQNVDEIFSEKNLNKLEAAFGVDYKEAIKNILKRMKTGRNRAFGGDSLTGRFVDWMTSATGAIMFFNTRSAVLQTLSSVNFINFGDNNIFAATKAFANQKQYWSDFKMLFNSEFLVERRDGLKINVNEADIADIAKEKGVRGIINKMLKLGFTPTQLADSFAIATGGATFYRNRLKSLIKDGMDPVAAEKQAMRDFRETAEESQQSSRPDKISSQQAGPLGRTVLAFANTPAQYARIIKKAASDIKNGRGDFKTNISKIMYYGVAQNLVFNALQQALFAALFDEEEELIDDKTLGIANGMADSLLRGIGISGAIISVLKNVAVRGVKESKKSNPKFENAAFELIKISPPVSSKINKIRAAARSYDWDKKEMKEGGLSIDNPAFLAAGNVVSATTNIPLDRVIKKIQHLKTASDSEIETYKRIFLLAGWSEWELGIKKPSKKKSRKNYSKKKYYK